MGAPNGDLGVHAEILPAADDGEVGPLRAERALRDPRQRLPAAKISISSASEARSILRLAVKGAHPGLAAFLCELAGLEIQALRRIRLGRVSLGDVAPGQWRYLAEYERF